MQATKLINILFSSLINTEYIGKTLFYLPQCHSTNDLAVEKCKNNKLNSGSIFITSNQIAGKGQRGNKWISEAEKNLTFSIVIEIEFNSLAFIFKHNMLLSAALFDYLNDYDENFKIKWPNDIYYKSKKIAGILVESVRGYNDSKILVVGIGLNINQTSFKYLNATSLQTIINKKLDLQTVLESICQKIETYFRLIHLDSTLIIENVYLKKLYQFDIDAIYKTNDDVFEGKIKTVLNDGRIGIEKNKKLIFFERKQLVYL